MLSMRYHRAYEKDEEDTKKKEKNDSKSII